MKYEVLRLDHVQCDDPTPAFLDLTFNIYRGEVLGAWVQNQMRSRQLVRLLTGEAKHDGGHLYVGGQEVPALNPELARRLGIAYVGPQPTLVPTMGIAENLFATTDVFYPHGVYKRKLMDLSAFEWLELAGLTELRPRMLVRELTIAHAHIIEVLKAVVSGAQVVVLDNIFKYYSDKQRDVLFAFLRFFKESDSFSTSLLLVGDAYSKLWSLADRGAILRHGRCVAVLPPQYLTREYLSKYAMPPRDEAQGAALVPAHEVFSVRRTAEAGSEAMLRLYTGRVMGVLDENQSFRRMDLPRLKGAIPPGLSFCLEGKPLRPGRLKRTLGRELCVVNCHEIGDSVIESMDLYQNVMLKMTKPVYGALGYENRRLMAYTTRNVLARLNAMDLYEQFAGEKRLTNLSHSQKFTIFLARFVAIQPKVLIIIDPQICFDDARSPRFVSLMQSVCASQIALAIISSTQDILFSVADDWLVWDHAAAFLAEEGPKMAIEDLERG